jgi:hypothetical protein
LARCSRYVAQVKRGQAVSSSSGEEEVWDVTDKSIEEIRGFLIKIHKMGERFPCEEFLWRLMGS